MKKWLIAAALLASLTACDNHSGNNTFSDYIARLIGSESCENNTPQDVNSANVSLDNENEVNVNNITPGCG